MNGVDGVQNFVNNNAISSSIWPQSKIALDVNALPEAIYMVTDTERSFALKLVPWVHAEWKRGDEQTASHCRSYAPVCLFSVRNLTRNRSKIGPASRSDVFSRAPSPLFTPYQNARHICPTPPSTPPIITVSHWGGWCSDDEINCGDWLSSQRESSCRSMLPITVVAMAWWLGLQVEEWLNLDYLCFLIGIVHMCKGKVPI